MRKKENLKKEEKRLKGIKTARVTTNNGPGLRMKLQRGSQNGSEGTQAEWAGQFLGGLLAARAVFLSKSSSETFIHSPRVVSPSVGDVLSTL